MGLLDFLDQAKAVVTKWVVGTLDAQDLDKLNEFRDSTTDEFMETPLGKVLTGEFIDSVKSEAQTLDLKKIKSDLLGMVSEMLPNVDLSIFKNMIKEVHTDTEQTPKFELSTQFNEYYKQVETGTTSKTITPTEENPIIKSGGSGGSEVYTAPTKTPTKHFLASSPNVMNEETLLKEIKRVKTGHIIVSILIGVISVIVEIMSLGQIDALHEMMSIIYNLSTWSTIYDQSKGMETEISLLRVYRYYLEKENLTNIPGVSDLITMLTREQLGDTQEEGLATFTRFMKYYGFDEYWSKAYWGSHWVLPGTGELYAMFGRGIISKDTLKEQLIINDIKPEWIEKLVDLSQRIPSRTEARLISRVRRISEDKLDRILQNERIHPDFLEDYKYFLQNQELDTIQLQELSRYKDLFIQGYISEEAYKEQLSTSVLSTHEQEASLRRDQADQLKDIIKRDVDSTIDIFKIRAKAFIKDENPDGIQRALLEVDLKKLIPNVSVRDSIIDNVFANLGLEFDLEDLDR